MSDTEQTPKRESPEPINTTTHVTGGVNLDAEQIHIGGDLVSGDKLVAQEYKATGKNIIQIGALNIPVVPFAMAVVAGVAVLIFIALNLQSIQAQLPAVTPTPAKMSSDKFNVAIAEFGEEGPDGETRLTDNGRQLSKTVYDTLLAQRDAFPDPIIKSSIEIRYAGLPITNGVVLDESEAALVTERLGADVLIYGNLDRQSRLTPKFHLSPAVRAEVDALLTGEHRFGDQPIQFDPASRVNAALDLRNRASAMLYIVMGLTYDVFGRVEKSLEVYRQAEQNLTDWADQGQGKEILYFFKGQAALFSKQRSSGSASAAREAEAEEAFKKAAASNPRYARAYIGLGSVLFLRLQDSLTISHTADSSLVTQTLEAYNRGLDLARESGDQLAEYVTLYSQGTAYYLQGVDNRFRGDTARADESFATASGLIESTLIPFADLKQPRLIAQARLALGAIYKQQAELRATQGDRAGSIKLYDQARQSLTQCVEQGQSSQDRVLTDLIVRERCQPSLEAVKRALGTP